MLRPSPGSHRCQGRRRPPRWGTAVHLVALVALLCACGGGAADRSRSTSPATGSSAVEGDRTSTHFGCEPDRAVADAEPVALPRDWSVPLIVNPSASFVNVDLNGDGIADTVLSGWPDDSTGADPPMLALDGRSGGTLWRSSEHIAAIAAPLVTDLTRDGIPDVVVGGRGLPNSDRPLVALDGRDGSTLWVVAPAEPTWQNVYTPRRIDDVDGDGVDDIVVTTGGDHLRADYDPPTVAGRIAVISGRSGKILGMLPTADGRELYSSPVLVPSAGGPTALFGSGGEVFGGSLWEVPVGSIAHGNADEALEAVLPGGGSSFIAPLTVGPIAAPATTTAVAVRLDGTVYALDVVDGSVAGELWRSEEVPELVERSVGPGEEKIMAAGLSPAAVAQLDDDEQLEVIIQFSVLPKQDVERDDYGEGCSVIAVFDGRTGKLQWTLQGGRTGSVVSPLTVTQPGGTAVLCACVQIPSSKRTQLALWYPTADRVELVGVGAQLSATPFVVDGPDGRPVLTVGEYTESREDGDDRPRPPLVSRLRLGEGTVVWGGYMGPANDGWVTDTDR